MFDLVEEDVLNQQNDQPNNKVGVVRSLSNVVRWLSNSVLGSKERDHFDKLKVLLESSTMFRFCSPEKREKVATHMTLIEFKKGDVLINQGDKQSEAFVIVEGSVTRQRFVREQRHTIGPLGYAGSKDSIGMLHLLNQEPSYSSVIAMTNGVAFVLPTEVLEGLLVEDHQLSNQVIQSLVVELRQQSYFERTPLFLQQGKDLQRSPLNFFAVSVAASIESFYRSGLNAILISQLTGTKAA